MNCVPRTNIADYLRIRTSNAKPGFFLADWEELEESLKDLAQRNKVINVEKTSFGMRYDIDGKINTPNQRNPFIRTVWFIEQTTPIFVTAYPNRNNIMIKELDTVVISFTNSHKSHSPRKRHKKAK